MAEPSTTPVSSASTDDAASEPCRYANDSEAMLQSIVKKIDNKASGKKSKEKKVEALWMNYVQ